MSGTIIKVHVGEKVTIQKRANNTTYKLMVYAEETVVASKVALYKSAIGDVVEFLQAEYPQATLSSDVVNLLNNEE